MWRTLFVDIPVWLVDRAWTGYLLAIAGLSLVCIVTSLLWLALALAGYPLP
jgi:hypothetical protein